MKNLFLIILLCLFFSAKAQTTESTVPDSMLFKPDTMPQAFAGMGPRKLIRNYAFDADAKDMIRAYYYNSRKRALILPGIAGIGLSAFLYANAGAEIKANQFTGIILIPVVICSALSSGYLVYKGVEGIVYARNKSDLYARLKAYHDTGELTKFDQRVLENFGNRYIPFLFEITGLIER